MSTKQRKSLEQVVNENFQPDIVEEHFKEYVEKLLKNDDYILIMLKLRMEQPVIYEFIIAMLSNSYKEAFADCMLNVLRTLTKEGYLSLV